MSTLAPAVAAAPERSPSTYTLMLAAIGVVYGDIGTSPLYALRECFSGPHAVVATPENLLGIVSLFFWALMLVISLKYVTFVMRADNRGEGGILALLALTLEGLPASSRRRGVLIGLGLCGAALFYGDGVITPAISVLSAVEGLGVFAYGFDPYVVPLTLVILVVLFLVQRHGTARIGGAFGPVMLVWFLVLAVLGIWHALSEPRVFAAFDPRYAIAFFADNGAHGFVVLGAVFLCVTGGEALYADMGHFGRRPIRLAWFCLVLPALLLNYLGQTALMLREPAASANPFYRMVPEPLLLPMVGLATVATVIAAQAVISGVFSLTRQAVQLGYSPRVEVVHTSSDHSGQIYVPVANWLLLAAVLLVVLGFGSSSNLAAAYGISVTITMLVTGLLMVFLAFSHWHWRWWQCVALGALFLAVDLAFLGANALKIMQGGWLPLVMGGSLLVMMTTWKRGRELLALRLAEDTIPLDLFINDIAANTPRVPGTAVFLTSRACDLPHALLHNLKHNKIVHQRVIFLTVESVEQPRVGDDLRVSVEPLGYGFHRVVARYGFMEDPDVPDVLALCERFGLEFELQDTTFFLGRETVIATSRPGMARWRERLFVAMSRNAARAMDVFRLPTNRVVELGTQVEM